MLYITPELLKRVGLFKRIIAMYILLLNLIGTKYRTFRLQYMQDWLIASSVVVRLIVYYNKLIILFIGSGVTESTCYETIHYKSLLLTK